MNSRQSFLYGISFRIMAVMIVGLGCIVLGALLFQKQYTASQKKLIVAEKHEKEQAFDSILELKGAVLAMLAKDYSAWDEVVDLIDGKKSKEWADENIATLIPVFGAQAVWYYSLSGEIAYESNMLPLPVRAAGIVPVGHIPTLFARAHFTDYFVYHGKELVEARAATIVYSADGVERKGPIKGYLFVAREWDATYVKSLEDVTDSRISIIAFTPFAYEELSREAREKGNVFCKTLPGWDREPVAIMRVAYPSFAQYWFRGFDKQLLMLLVVFGLGSLVSLFYLLMAWVHAPISSLARALVSGDLGYVKKIERQKSEFGELARLIGKFMLQQGYLKQEVVERIKIGDDLRNAKEYLDTLINIISEPLFVKDDQHRWVLLNDAFCIFIGHPREELLNRSDYEFFPKEQADVFWNKDEIVLRSSDENVNEELFTDAKGVVHTIVTKKKHFVDKSGKKYLVGLISDISELRHQEEELKAAYRKLKEAQQELIQTGKMAAMGQLAAGVSHELNQPLTGIKGFAQSMLMEIDPASPLREDLMKIVEQADRMDRIIKNVRFFARKSEFQFELIDISQPIMSSAAFLGEQLRIRNILVTTEFPQGLPKIKGDLNQLQQVFINLITNARDAIESAQRPQGGTVKIAVRVDEPKKFLEVTVTDDGCGIPKENLEYIFNPFYTTKSPNGGMGLGLAIIYRIMESHGGSITASSVFGVGTTFRMVFPLGNT